MTQLTPPAEVGTPPPPHRLPDLKSSPGHLIRVVQQVHTELWRRHLGDSVTSIQYACLLAIAAEPGLDQQTLGTRVSLDKATVADVVRRMVDAQWIERVQTSEDRRRRLLELTPRGRRVWKDNLAAVLMVQQEILAPLKAADRRMLLQTLTKVSGGFAGRVDVPLDSGITLHTAPGHLIRRAQQRHWTLWLQKVGRAVTSVQYGVLLGMYDSPPLSQAAIGALASLDKSSAADVLSRLDGRGLILRSPDPLDRRRNVVEITDEGATVVDVLATSVVEVQKLLFTPLDRFEREQFVCLMGRVCRLAP